MSNLKLALNRRITSERNSGALAFRLGDTITLPEDTNNTFNVYFGRLGVSKVFLGSKAINIQFNNTDVNS